MLSLLPVVDREKRQKGGKEFLRRCAEDIINSDLDLETKKPCCCGRRYSPAWFSTKKQLTLFSGSGTNA
ncbi:hypothetical protein MTHERMOG20_26130 [Moorella thermoacetica]|nr:hypothetical protein MTHERMOG20_26130 [Moorella thermoacetica]